MVDNFVQSAYVTYTMIYFIVFLDLFLIVRNPFFPQKKRLKYYYAAIGLTFASVFTIEVIEDSHQEWDNWLHPILQVIRLLPVITTTPILISLVCRLKR